MRGGEWTYAAQLGQKEKMNIRRDALPMQDVQIGRARDLTKQLAVQKASGVTRSQPECVETRECTLPALLSIKRTLL